MSPSHGCACVASPNRAGSASRSTLPPERMMPTRRLRTTDLRQQGGHAVAGRGLTWLRACPSRRIAARPARRRRSSRRVGVRRIRNDRSQVPRRSRSWCRARSRVERTARERTCAIGGPLARKIEPAGAQPRKGGGDGASPHSPAAHEPDRGARERSTRRCLHAMTPDGYGSPGSAGEAARVRTGPARG